MTKIYKSLSKIVTYAASSNNGYIEQIQGDGYLCTFYDSRELASGGNAINAAIDILTYIDSAYNEVADCNHQINCGIGIRTGNIYVANLVPKGENDLMPLPFQAISPILHQKCVMWRTEGKFYLTI